MTAAAKRPNDRRETLNIRVRAETRNLIDRAAKMRGENRSHFILEAARRAAEEALLDHALVSVSAAAYADFVTRLDEAPCPNERLRRTMKTRPPWKSE